MKENIKENKKTDTKAQNDLSLLFKYRKFLMGFAALWILMTHEWQIVTNETSFFFVTENFIKRIGFCGVDIFLLLSGMGLYYSLEKNPVSRFYYNRLKRVIFPFIIMASIVSQIDHWTNEFECIKNEESNELKYISESKNMEYQYSVNNCGVKENIVLNEKPETNIFEYKIETKNLYLKKQENDKGLLVYDKNTNKIIGTIEAPFLVDADGKEDYKSVEYKLEKDGENEALKVIVSNDYFENEATKYPVTIDPTMVWMFDYLTTASVWSVDFQQNVNMHNHYLGAMNNMMSSYPYNSEEHVYLDTSNLLTGSALVGSGLNIRGKYIESASLNLYESSYRAPYKVGTLELRTAKDSWNPDTITWNNKPGASEEVLLEEKFTGVEGTRHCLDITKWVQDIADEQIENNGLVFTAKKRRSSIVLWSGSTLHTGRKWNEQ